MNSTQRLQKQIHAGRASIRIYVGLTRNALCPISATLTYLAVCGDKKGPLFHFDDGRSSMRERFMQAVCNAVAKTGQVYVAQSFRIRSVMTAAHYGILNLVIQILGWWQSSVYLLYVCTLMEHLANITSTFSKPLT